MVITFANELDVKKLTNRVEPSRILICSPEFFDVIDVKNIHMVDSVIDKKRAIKQWEEIKNIYDKLVKEDILEEVLIIEGQQGCEDMVFTANQTFPWLDQSGRKIMVPSIMRHNSRKKEVPYFIDYFKKLHYSIIPLKNTTLFEGMGDLIPLPNKNLLFGGHGHRTDIAAYHELSEILKTHIVTLRLINNRFYHLDTCFVPISENVVMIFPKSFDEDGLELIHSIFSTVIEVPEEEALNFSLNAHLISNQKGKVAILQKGNPVTVEALRNNGFDIYEVDTSEYIKSGGSVFCMKMMVY